MSQESVQLQVSRTSNVRKVASAIFANVIQDKHVTILTVGEQALNQMTKALCLGRGDLAQKGKNLCWYSGFRTIEGTRSGDRISAIETTLFLFVPR